MSPRRAAVALLLVGILMRPPVVAAGGLRHLDDGWLAGPGELAAVMAQAAVRPVDDGGRWWAGLGTGRLFGMPELALRALGLAWQTPLLGAAWELEGTWRATGGGLLATNGWVVQGGLGGAWPLRVRLEGEAMRLGGQDGPAHREADLVLGRRGRMLAAELHLPLDGAPAAGTRRVRPVARCRASAGGVALVVSCERRGADALALGGELVLAWGGAAVLVRWDGASHSVGPGLAVVRGPLMVRTSHVVHPELGISHRLQCVVTGRAW